MEVLERPLIDLQSSVDLIKAVRDLATGPLAELADDIDRRGIYPKSILHRLGELGALKAHMAGHGKPADYGLAISAMTEVSRVCGATGFMVWCHDVCGLYMEQSGNPALGGELLARHADGQTLGATGMSNPMKTFAGIETFLLHAQKVDGGYLVNGTLPWVSNLGPDHYFGAVADVVVDGANGPIKVAEMGANAIVGEIAILCDIARTATVIARTEIEALRISKENFLKLLSDFPEMTIEVMRVLAQRLSHTTIELTEARSLAAQGGR